MSKAALALALKNGYLTVTGGTNITAENAWWYDCRARRVPFAVVRRTGRKVMVRVDLSTTDLDFTPTALSEIKLLGRKVNPDAFECGSSTGSASIKNVPLGKAAYVMGEMMKLASTAVCPHGAAGRVS